MITPLTDDIKTIRHLLPSLGTDLVYIQGSRLSSAFDMASAMLEAEPGSNKAILVISDGGFEDAAAISVVRKLAEKGIVIHAMGIGTTTGAPLQDHQGNVVKKNGVPILSKLEKEKLVEISKMGNGRYLEAHYSDHDEAAILKELETRADAQMNIGKKNRFWDEHFYLLLIPALPIVLWWFRRGYIFAVLLLFFAPSIKLEAAGIRDYFMNSEEKGKEALDSNDYETAAGAFQDPYRKGVACYRAGNFTEAERMFRQSTREDVASSAAYNLGNTLVQQEKLKEAIAAYEDVLNEWPDHTKAKENLELVKKMLEQQKQENSGDQQDQNKNDSKDNEEQSEGKNNKEGQDSKGSDNKDQDQQQDQQEQKQGEDQQDNKDPAEGQEEQKNEEEEQEAGQENAQESETQNAEEREAQEEPQPDPKDEAQAKAAKSQQDQDADVWLNRISNDPKTFMKNKFYIESKRSGTTEGMDPW